MNSIVGTIHLLVCGSCGRFYQKGYMCERCLATPERQAEREVLEAAKNYADACASGEEAAVIGGLHLKLCAAVYRLQDLHPNEQAKRPEEAPGADLRREFERDARQWPATITRDGEVYERDWSVLVPTWRVTAEYEKCAVGESYRGLQAWGGGYLDAVRFIKTTPSTRTS